MLRKIIGLMGKQGVGKSTVAKELARVFTKISDTATVTSFGSILKDDVMDQLIEHSVPVSKDAAYTVKGKQEALNVPRAEFASWFGITYNKPNADVALLTIREALQFYGTDLRRVEDPDYWIDRIVSVWSRAEQCGTRNIIVDDVRLPNEAFAIVQYAKNWGCCAELHYIEPYLGYTYEDAHLSENGLSDEFINTVATRWHPKYGELDCVAYGILMKKD